MSQKVEQTIQSFLANGMQSFHKTTTNPYLFDSTLAVWGGYHQDMLLPKCYLYPEFGDLSVQISESVFKNEVKCSSRDNMEQSKKDNEKQQEPGSCVQYAGAAYV